MQVEDICTRGDLRQCRSDGRGAAHAQHGVRRMPILDSDANLVGIISIDDVIEILARGDELPRSPDLARTVAAQGNSRQTGFALTRK